MTENELKDKMYQKLSLYSNELEDRIEDLEKLNTTITMENERLINEMRKLEKDNQTLMNSMVTEAHTKETEEIERLNNIINDLLKRQNEALNYISNFLSMDNRYKHGNGNDELELVRRILNKHNQELKGSEKE